MNYKDIFNTPDKYWAHLPKGNESIPVESLVEHSELVSTYTQKICDEFGLISTIRLLIESSLKNDSTHALKEFIEQVLFDSIYFHDFGKINPNFQVLKMKNPKFKTERLEFGSDHSYPGALMFINTYLSSCIENGELRKEEKLTAVVFLFLFTFQISRHHSSYLSSAVEYIKEKLDFSNDDKKVNLEQIVKLLAEQEQLEKSKFWDVISKGDYKTGNTWINKKLSKFFANKEGQNSNNFPLFALLKLHYSLLTASDYLATTHYMNNWKEPLIDFGCISEELRSRVIQNVRSSKDYNKKVFEFLDGYEFTYPTEPSNKNLNILRQELSIEVIQNIRTNIDEKLFYIEAPTGGGKTNLSMLATAELLDKHHEISNIYYVFPFTTLITQTYDVLKETMGLSEDEIIQLHSKEGFKEKEGGEYGLDKKNYIDYLFLNFPVALLSHVKFFEILKTNSKEANYLTHRLANSIVIVDELQTYPPKIWDKLIFFIQHYAHYFNIRFVLMSATLPKLHKLSHVAKDICYLTNNKKAIFQNPNFSKRVEFDFSLLDWEVPEKDDKHDFLEKLGKEVVAKSKEYAASNKKYPNSVFTIIEFIYKKTATDFYSVVNDLANDFFDEIFVLSGTILEPRRKEIIHYLKNAENRNKKVILITTQVVEAGVDIDMDLGFKDKSIVDSDEQLAGRINRNVNKSACKLYLFNCDNAEVLYKGDDRFTLLERAGTGLDREILQTKDFDKMYDEVMTKIDKRNGRIYQENFSDFTSAMQKLNFTEVDNGFRIINQQSSSVFVPIEIEIYVPGSNKEKRNFTEKEMQFLESYQVIEFDMQSVSGVKVFELYERLIKQDNDDFIEFKTELKKLQGIMSQFIFSLMTHSKSIEKLVLGAHGQERMGMYYLSHWKDDGVYDYKFGLLEKDQSAILF